MILEIPDFDKRLEKGDLELVNIIARNIGAVNMFSFASKYCTYHNAISIHHAVELVIALALISVLGNFWISTFIFNSAIKKGINYLSIFTAILALISVALHTFMALNNQLPVYTYPMLFMSTITVKLPFSAAALVMA